MPSRDPILAAVASCAPVQELARRHGYFSVVETGWPKMAPLFRPDGSYRRWREGWEVEIPAGIDVEKFFWQSDLVTESIDGFGDEVLYRNSWGDGLYLVFRTTRAATSASRSRQSTGWPAISSVIGGHMTCGTRLPMGR